MSLLKEFYMHTYESFILFGVSLVLVRLMGKRTIAQLSPFDLIVLIIMGAAVAIPLEDRRIKLSCGIIPITVISLLNYGLSVLITKSRKIENLLQGVSTVLVQNGEVNIKNLKKERITIADLLIMLREKDVTNINEVEEATIEPNGKLSVIKKKEMQNLTPNDLELDVCQGVFPTIIVDSGKIVSDNLDKVGVGIEQVLKELNKKGIKELSEIKACWINEEGDILFKNRI